ncbi:MAG: hypothetical protein IPO36_14490 [Anaerolineales bacterium]|nr:hypothetical protein [Anaerolineales bacterium]
MKPETGVSYFANGWPHHFKRDLDDILAHHCTYIVHSFSENEMVFARSRTAQFFKMTCDAGLSCWANPWAVMGLFGGEQFSAFVPRNPEACQILSTGQRAPAACPSADETRIAMKLWIDMAVDFGADTIFWDEPHLYIPDWDDLRFAPDSAFACFCPRCRISFQNRFGQPMPETLTAEMRLFREDLMVNFLTEMIGYAKDKGARNAITLLPVEDEASESLPWNRIADLRGLDIFGTDPYWFLHNKDCTEYVSSQMERTMQICAPRRLTPHFWAQGFGIPSGRENELETGFSLAVERGAQSIAIWGMHGNSAWDGASENPEKVWDVVGNTFGKFRK